MTADSTQAISSKSGVIISIDAMSGDRGPNTIIAGMTRALKENPEIRFIAHGDEQTLRRAISKRKALSARCAIRHTKEVVAMDDKPGHVMRHGKETSMWGAIDSVREGEATVAVSCGNTGALMAVSMFRLRKAPGVSRPAIAILWPSDNPTGFNIMLDVGADIRAEGEDLLKYALMGASYARNGQNIARPRVGLLNVGTEEHKGRAALKDATDLISAAANDNGIEFVGFVEGGDIPSSRVDVIVTDGFTGNVALKTAEGTATQIRMLLKNAFKHTLLSRIGALFALTSLRRFTNRIDPRRVNGGVFLGLNGTVIKSHGDADTMGVSAAIGLAYQLAKSGFSEKLAARVASGSVAHNDEATGSENIKDAS